MSHQDGIFQPPLYGKGYIHWTGGTVKRRVSEKVWAEGLDVPTTSEFANLAKTVCPNINILFADKKQLRQRSQN